MNAVARCATTRRMQRVPIVVSSVFPSTFILYYNSIRHENAVRDQQTRLSTMCSRSVGRVRFSSRFAFPERPQLRAAYVQLALIKNERHFFSYYVNGGYGVRGKRYCFIPGSALLSRSSLRMLFVYIYIYP